MERPRSSVQRSRAAHPSRGRRTQNSLRAGLSAGLVDPDHQCNRHTSHQSTFISSSSSISPQSPSVSLNSLYTNQENTMSGLSNAPSALTGTGGSNIPNIPVGGNQQQQHQHSARHRMPKPGEKNAPSFDPEKPEELGRFFDRIEDWYADEGLIDDTEKKRRIVKYLDADSEIQWKALSRFSNGTFEEFKAQAMASYPAAEEVMKGSVAALKRKLRKLGPIAADERDDLLALIRIMTAEVMKLKRITPPIHTNRELVELFLSRLTPDFAGRVAGKLSIHRLVDTAQNNNQVPRNPEDMYDIEDVMKMARHTSLEQANPFGKFLMVSSGSQASSGVKLEEAVARLTDTITLQTQYNKQMDQKLASLQSFMSQSRSMQNQGFGMNNQTTYNRSQPQASGAGYSNNAGKCFYCEEIGHRIPDCDDVHTHLDLGWIKKVDGFMRLPDGSRLPRDPSKSTKEIIEGMNRQKPGIIKLPEKTSLYSSTADVISLMQTHSRSEDKEILELVRKLGSDRAKSLLSTQVQTLQEEDEWEQNFE